jgi:hypothetical protein
MNGSTANAATSDLASHDIPPVRFVRDLRFSTRPSSVGIVTAVTGNRQGIPGVFPALPRDLANQQPKDHRQGRKSAPTVVSSTGFRHQGGGPRGATASRNNGLFCNFGGAFADQRKSGGIRFEQTGRVRRRPADPSTNRATGAARADRRKWYRPRNAEFRGSRKTDVGHGLWHSAGELEPTSREEFHPRPEQ